MLTRYAVTGSREGPVIAQRLLFIEWWVGMIPYVSHLHHGDCVGADEFVANLTELTGSTMRVIAHPSDMVRYTANAYRTETRPPQPPLVRNHVMVGETEALIALPDSMTERLRSGTWATMRYARDLGRRVTVFWPDGSVGSWPAD